MLSLKSVLSPQPQHYIRRQVTGLLYSLIPGGALLLCAPGVTVLVAGAFVRVAVLGLPVVSLWRVFWAP